MDKPIINEKEFRYFQSDIEVAEKRDDSGNVVSRTVSGYAAKYNKESQPLGGYYRFIEKISPGAFDDRLNDDIRALFNHDASLILARSKNGTGTLKLSLDETGLRYEFEAPNTTAGNDLIENIRLGNVSESSFSFEVEDDRWDVDDMGRDVRTIKKFRKLYDVAPVTYPAYLDTEVSVRKYNDHKNNRDIKPDGPSTEIKSKLLKLK